MKTVGLTDADGWADGFIEGWEEGSCETDGWADGFIEGWEEGSCETEGFNEGMAEAGTLDLDDFEVGSFFDDLLMVGS